MIDQDRFQDILAQVGARGYALNDEQREAVEFGTGPLWLLAGPGSGKSEVLVTRTLRLLCVEGVPPASVLLTTFTTKAARNLEDRLATYLSVLQETEPSLRSVDLADLRIGTLHSLCNDLLHEFRYPGYQNVRLLDDVEQHLFAYRFADIAQHEDLAFWASFSHAVSRWKPGASYPPNRWQRTRAGVILFNRIVEDLVDLSLMRNAGEHWERLAEFYEQYEGALRQYHRCDFAHVQARFLEFLGTPSGACLLDGDGEKAPPLQHILVDEYQDTNPIQERIYLALAERSPHNLTVCGDDDQALYRFRGGTVACMVNFDRACQALFAQAPHRIQLARNYRSHEGIVSFFNGYISSFPEMGVQGVRAPNKAPVEPASSIQGSYPAVAWVAAKKVADLPSGLCDLLQKHLLADGVIADLSQCVLLLRSAKDSPGNAGPYLRELEQRGIPVYNPRSKSFMESEEVQCLFGALVHVVDLDFWYKTIGGPNNKAPEWAAVVDTWISTLVAVSQNPSIPTDALEDYVEKSEEALRKLCKDRPGQFLQPNLLEILYRILALEPFRTWRQDPSRDVRIAKVTRLLESYHSLGMDVLRASGDGKALDLAFLNRFYMMFLCYLIEAGIDDDEDEDVIVPQGYLPVMTIHQSKGLEFPFVMVAQLGTNGSIGTAHILDNELAPFRQDLYPRETRAPAQLVVEDDIRLLYVAYSRAQYALILAASPSQLKGRVSVPGRNHTEFGRSVPVI